jgi:hypothetical protein
VSQSGQMSHNVLGDYFDLFDFYDYFNLNKRITKSMCDFETTPSLANARLRFFDFLVRM